VGFVNNPKFEHEGGKKKRQNCPKTETKITKQYHKTGWSQHHNKKKKKKRGQTKKKSLKKKL